MIKRITEIGVAVKDLKAMGNRLCGILGAKKGESIKIREFDMNMAFEVEDIIAAIIDMDRLHNWRSGHGL